MYKVYKCTVRIILNNHAPKAETVKITSSQLKKFIDEKYEFYRKVYGPTVSLDVSLKLWEDRFVR